ncbi:extracellular solute-binding protein [Phytohabitans kaempferiae]|uniref:Extracellular solute-binding protein n=1 Tax=Phytohabitans kaempferiae TaxID=1620943 RepID=A0ABV6MF97_9ACTN
MSAALTRGHERAFWCALPVSLSQCWDGSQMDRRYALRLTGLAVVAALTVVAGTGCGGSDPDPAPGAGELEDRLVIMGPGGDLGANYQKAFRQFADSSGVRIQYVEGVTTANLAKIVGQKANPQADILLGTMETYFAGQAQGLWAAVDKDVVTNLNRVPEWARVPGDAAVTPLLNVPVLFYNKEKYAAAGLAPPSDYQDLFIDEKLRGHVAIPDVDNGYTKAYLAMRSQRLAGSTADPTPAIEELLAKGKDWFYQFPHTPAQMGQLVASGQVWIGLDGATRVNDMRKQGMPVEWVVPSELAGIPLPWSAIKNGPHPNAAQAFLNWAVSPEGQEQLQTNTRINATTEVPPSAELQGQLLTPEDLKKVVKFDEETMVASSAAWKAAWGKLVGA